MCTAGLCVLQAGMPFMSTCLYKVYIHGLVLAGSLCRAADGADLATRRCSCGLHRFNESSQPLRCTADSCNTLPPTYFANPETLHYPRTAPSTCTRTHSAIWRAALAQTPTLACAQRSILCTFLTAAVGQMRLAAGPTTDTAAPAASPAQVPVAGLVPPPGMAIVASCCASLPATAFARAMQ